MTTTLSAATGTTVFVASFAPANDQGAIGGFEWRPDRAEAERRYVTMVRDFNAEVANDGGHIIRLLEIDVETDLADIQGVNAELDSRLDELELFAPALRQYVPTTTESTRIPLGGIRRGEAPELCLEMAEKPITYRYISCPFDPARTERFANLAELYETAMCTPSWFTETRLGPVGRFADPRIEDENTRQFYRALAAQAPSLVRDAHNGEHIVHWGADTGRELIVHPVKVALLLAQAREGWPDYLEMRIGDTVTTTASQA